MVISYPRQPPAVIPRALVLAAALFLAALVAPSRGFLVHAPSAVASPRRQGRSSFVSASSAAYSGGDARRRSSDEQAGSAGWAVASKSPRADAGLPSRASRVSMMATPLPDTAKTPPSDPETPPALVYGESAKRSFVKALCWRLTAGVVTLISGLVFSGSLSTAMRIVGSDFISKSGFMFAGERLWNKVKWGQGKTGDSTKRSLAKAVLWRAFAATNTLICGVFLAKDLSVASKIAGTDTIFKTALFFMNERIWNSIQWGKEFEPEYFI